MAGRKYDPERVAQAALLPPPVSPEGDRLWTIGQRSLIDVTDDCWLWTGRVDDDGYGRSTNGRLAHRVSYQYWVGEIPDGHHVDHACHNADLTCTGAPCLHRRCVRPDHLQARDAIDNMSDQYSTRRSHCSNGHELTAENAIPGPGRRRICRACRRLYVDSGGQFHPRPFPVGPPTRQYDESTGLREALKAGDSDTREIHLRDGAVALVDAADWPLVQRYRWYLRIESNHWVYARGIRRVNGKTEWVMLHRLLMQPPRGQRVYHRSGNGLDNRRANLRLGARTTGVSWNSKLGKWRAFSRIDGKYRSLGHFVTKDEAVNACAAVAPDSLRPAA